jgi:hypothetical protein
LERCARDENAMMSVERDESSIEEGVFVFEAVSFVHAQTRPRHRVEEGFVFEQYFVRGDDDVARVFEAALVEVEATRGLHSYFWMRERDEPSPMYTTTLISGDHF